MGRHSWQVFIIKAPLPNIIGLWAIQNRFPQPLLAQDTKVQVPTIGYSHPAIWHGKPIAPLVGTAPNGPYDIAVLFASIIYCYGKTTWAPPETPSNACCSGGFKLLRLWPQNSQNMAATPTSLWHLGQQILTESENPHLLQNFAPWLLKFPQFLQLLWFSFGPFMGMPIS